MRKLLLLLMAITCLGMIGCGASPMQNFRFVEINKTVNPDESIIVFFTPVKHRRLHIPIVETDENGNLSLVTILFTGTKYLHRTTPGKHLYFLSSVGGQSEMLEANMEAGKTYYTYVSQHSFSFQFIPVSTPDDKFKEDFGLCRWYRNAGLAGDWFEGNLPNLQRRSNESYIKHQEADSKKIILPEHGTDTPI